MCSMAQLWAHFYGWYKHVSKLSTHGWFYHYNFLQLAVPRGSACPVPIGGGIYCLRRNAVGYGLYQARPAWRPTGWGPQVM